jgi:hexokinase
MDAPNRDSSDWIKLDLHIHTRDDPKDTLDFSAHQLLARANRVVVPIVDAIAIEIGLTDFGPVFGGIRV